MKFRSIGNRVSKESYRKELFLKRKDTEERIVDRCRYVVLPVEVVAIVSM